MIQGEVGKASQKDNLTCSINRKYLNQLNVEIFFSIEYKAGSIRQNVIWTRIASINGKWSDQSKSVGLMSCIRPEI